MPAQVILLCGPTGSGKTFLAEQSGLPVLRLDDFFKEHHDPTLPLRTDGTAHWDDPRSWDAERALRAIRSLCTSGRALVPEYDLRRSERVGEHTLALGNARVFVADGFFAASLAEPLRLEGLLSEAYVVADPSWRVTARRIRRDLQERRKAPATIVRTAIVGHRQIPRLVREYEHQGAQALAQHAISARLRSAGR